MKKRIFSMFLALVMALSLLPTVALADAAESHAHFACGTPACAHEHGDIAPTLTYVALSGEVVGSSISEGSYYLAGDVTLTTSNITVAKGTTLNLCLNGHVLTGTGTGSVITVNGGGTLNICDCNGSGSTHKFKVSEEDGTKGLWVQDDTNGTKIVTGGVITGGNSSMYGGGVNVKCSVLQSAYGSFSMYGGSIIGNTASTSGGGIYIDMSCTFNMYGGNIIGNAASYGGGVSICIGKTSFSGKCIVKDNVNKNAPTKKSNVFMQATTIRQSCGQQRTAIRSERARLRSAPT